MLGASKLDPSTAGFNDIFFAAANGMAAQSADNCDETQKKPSVWPILTFLSFIFVTPYLIMKLIGQVSTAAIEECKTDISLELSLNDKYFWSNAINYFIAKNPATWVQPSTVKAMYSFRASNAHELSFQAGQHIIVAPREVQQTQKLLNTGWALASIDHRTSGLIPINYVQRITVDSNHSDATDAKPAAAETVKNIQEPAPDVGINDPAPYQLIYSGDSIDSNLYGAWMRRH